MTTNADPSHGYKWLLLISSLVTLAFLLASATQEVFLNEWRRHQLHYKALLQQKASNSEQRQAAADFPIELRQITVPELNAVDRCVSCHTGIEDPRMSDAPQPFRSHSGNILQNHPADRFGCTVCHDGQGAAVDYRQAHSADVYWDYPLLPVMFTQAACGSCHDPRQLPQDQARLLVLGAQLYQQQSCGSCHKLAGRGGNLSMALDNEGQKTKHQLPLAYLKGSQTSWNWFEQHFRDPQAIVPGSLMKKPSLNEVEVQALTTYMLSLRQRVLPQGYIAKDKAEETYARLHGGIYDGAALYRQYCFACHGSGREGILDDQFNHFIPALRSPSLLRTATREFFIANISRGRPGTLMPSWDITSGGLQRAEIEAIVDYLRKDAPRQTMTLPGLGTVAAKGDAKRGAALFESQCSACHSPDGTGTAPELSNRTFQETASDEFIFATVRNGRDNTLMQAFQQPGGKGLKDEELADLVAYIRQLGMERKH